MNRILILNSSFGDIRARFGDVDAGQVATAVHEAGHAVVALVLGFRVSEVWIARTPPRTWEGRCHFDSDAQVAAARQRARTTGASESIAQAAAESATAILTGLVTAGGSAATSLLDGAIRAQGGEPLHSAIDSDWQDICADAARSGGSRAPLRFWEDSRRGAARLLTVCRPQLDALASALLRRGRLDEDQIATIVGPLADRGRSVPPQESAPLTSPMAYRSPERRHPSPYAPTGMRYADPVLLHRGERR